MEIKEFKIRDLTPEQSKGIQETLFNNGYKWASGESCVKNTMIPLLRFEGELYYKVNYWLQNK